MLCVVLIENLTLEICSEKMTRPDSPTGGAFFLKQGVHTQKTLVLSCFKKFFSLRLLSGGVGCLVLLSAVF